MLLRTLHRGSGLAKPRRSDFRWKFGGPPTGRSATRTKSAARLEFRPVELVADVWRRDGVRAGGAGDVGPRTGQADCALERDAAGPVDDVLSGRVRNANRARDFSG